MLLSLLLTIVFWGGHPATLLVPPHAEGERLPAVVVLHDHGAWFTIGQEKMAFPEWRDDLDSLGNLRLQAESRAWVDRCYSGIYVADSLAKEGFVVLVTDALYWGRRRVEPGAEQTPPSLRDTCLRSSMESTGLQSRAEDRLNRFTSNSEEELKKFNKALQKAQPAFYEQHLQETGEAWFETILREDIESVDYLCSLPFVDTTKIFCFGFSMGAYRSWQLAAADPRIAGCAAANWMTTIRYTGGFITGSSSWAMYRPVPEGADSTDYDYPMIAAKISPRPFLLLYGTKDHVIPAAGTKMAIRTIRRQYKSRQFRTVAFPADHVFTPEHYQTLLHWLKKNQ